MMALCSTHPKEATAGTASLTLISPSQSQRLIQCVFQYIIPTFKTENRNHGCLCLQSPKVFPLTSALVIQKLLHYGATSVMITLIQMC